ncbi:MAG: cyclase family protein [Actinomycetota bacterium]
MEKIIDISVPIYTGMPFYPGDPGAEIEPAGQISDGAIANLSLLKLGSHSGTHIDAPHHFVDDGKTVDRLSLEALVGPVRVLDLTGVESSIDRGQLESSGLEGVARLLLKTSNSGLWSSADFSEDYVSLSGPAADYLVNLGIVLLGIDYLSIEQFKSEDYHVHHALLGAGVVVLEGIDLGQVEAGDYELVCLPLKIRGGDGAPARAILIDKS